MVIVTDREFDHSYGCRRLRRQQTADRVAETEAEGSPLKPQRAESELEMAPGFETHLLPGDTFSARWYLLNIATNWEPSIEMLETMRLISSTGTNFKYQFQTYRKWLI